MICKVYGDWSVHVRLSPEGSFTFERQRQELSVKGMIIAGNGIESDSSVDTL
jgi:hypothetical protein